MVGTNEKNTGTTPRGPVRGVQECVQEWRRKGCESRFRPSHPVRLTPQLFAYLAKLAFSAACSRVRRVASYTKGHRNQNVHRRFVWANDGTTECVTRCTSHVPRQDSLPHSCDVRRVTCNVP